MKINLKNGFQSISQDRFLYSLYQCILRAVRMRHVLEYI